MRKITAEYYTLNAKVLPPNGASTARYQSLIENWHNKGYKIITKSDKNHYYTLREMSKVAEGKVYYGVISKFVLFDSIDFIDSETGRLLPQPIPENIEGRVNEYEFVFVPECHRFALIKIGKIDGAVKKTGAPLKKFQEIIKIAFENGLDIGESAIVETVQDDFIFNEIISSDLLSLEIRVSYTNDDLLPEGKRLMDSMLKENHIGEFFARLKPDNTGIIDTSEGGITRSLLELAKENGTVKAKIDTGEDKKVINSVDFPSLQSVEVNNDSSRIPTFINSIYRKFVDKYRPQN